MKNNRWLSTSLIVVIVSFFLSLFSGCGMYLILPEEGCERDSDCVGITTCQSGLCVPPIKDGGLLEEVLVDDGGVKPEIVAEVDSNEKETSLEKEAPEKEVFEKVYLEKSPEEKVFDLDLEMIPDQKEEVSPEKEPVLETSLEKIKEEVVPEPQIEKIPEPPTPEPPAPERNCKEGSTRPCKNHCGVGIETCKNDRWGGCSAPKASIEICDGKDNNCNSMVDEGYAEKGKSCKTSTLANGTVTGCVAGKTVCTPLPHLLFGKTGGGRICVAVQFYAGGWVYSPIRCGTLVHLYKSEVTRTSSRLVKAIKARRDPEAKGAFTLLVKGVGMSVPAWGSSPGCHEWVLFTGESQRTAWNRNTYKQNAKDLSPPSGWDKSYGGCSPANKIMIVLKN